MSERAAVAVSERFDRIAIAAQQIQAHAQSRRRRRAAIWLLFQLGRGFAQFAIVAVALPNRGNDLHDLVWPERTRRQDNLLHDGFSANRHNAKLLKDHDSIMYESQRSESNRQPPHYECGALPIEATRTIVGAAEDRPVISLAYDWAAKSVKG